MERTCMMPDRWLLDLFPTASFYELGLIRQMVYAVPSGTSLEMFLRAIRYEGIIG